MVQNYDLKTVHAEIGAADANIIADAVPASMKRYITYIKYVNTNTVAQELAIYDAPTTASIVDAAVLDKQNLSAGDTIMFPDSPDPESPVMKVEAGHFLVAGATTGDFTKVTVQYYDE